MLLIWYLRRFSNFCPNFSGEDQFTGNLICNLPYHDVFIFITDDDVCAKIGFQDLVERKASASKFCLAKKYYKTYSSVQQSAYFVCGKVLNPFPNDKF